MASIPHQPQQSHQPHPEVPPPTCMSCGRDLSPTPMLFTLSNPCRGVPADVECCWACWRRIPPHERIRIVIAIRDRQLGGVLNFIAELVYNGLLQSPGGTGCDGSENDDGNGGGNGGRGNGGRGGRGNGPRRD